MKEDPVKACLKTPEEVKTFYALIELRLEELYLKTLKYLILRGETEWIEELNKAHGKKVDINK